MSQSPFPAGQPGIARTGLCRARGNHLVAQNDEPEPLSEAQRLEVDRAFNHLKNTDPFRQGEADRASRMEPR